ncbi:hypothetical protein IJ707_02735, partial [bacterium]|nr:hypothetical protein [bacterium]
NYHIIYYCQEFKQYSTDVFFFMLVLLIFSKIDIRKITLKTYILTSLIMLCSTMISLPILFVIAGWFVMNILKYKLAIIKNILLYIPVFIIFVLYTMFFLLTAKMNVDAANIHFWDKGYLNFNILSILSMIKDCYNYCFEPNTYVLIIFICSCIGWYFIIKNSKFKSIYFLTFLSFCFVILASYLKLYPLENRAGLFFTPIVILTLIMPVDKLKNIYLVLFLLIISLSSYNFGYIKSFFNSNVFVYKNARKITKILKEKYEIGDTLIYNATSMSGYEYYANQLKLDIKDCVILQFSNVSNEENTAILNESLSYLKPDKYYIFYVVYDLSKPTLPLIKEWLKNKNKLWEYEVNGSYIAKIKI